MKNTFVALALAASALARPQDAVTSAVAPEESTPSSCSDSADGEFSISVVNVTDSATKRSFAKRQLDGLLKLTLEGGELTDQAGRTGYIASNFQFQFDSPPQAGALFTNGFSLCSNGSVALGGSAIWYQCWSGGFFNLYDRDWADHCVAAYMVASMGGGAEVSQTDDGQPKVPTAAPVTQLTDGQPNVPTMVPVTQLSDGQPNVPTMVPVTQLSDGQPNVPTGIPVTQISDGQLQVPTGPVVSQISDGQPQIPVATGNYTVPNATATAPAEFTGAAAATGYAAGAFAAGLMGLAALL